MDDNISQFLNGIEKGFKDAQQHVEEEKRKYKIAMKKSKDKIKEETPFPKLLAGFITVYCFLGGILYNYIKVPQMTASSVWTDWVFYFQVYLTFWILIPLYSGIHSNYTEGTKKLSSFAKKVVNKIIFISVGMLIWNYFGLTETRWLPWWLLFFMHFAFLRMFIYLHPLAFNFLTRINSKLVYPMAGTFLLAYFGGILLSTKFKKELLFHHNQISLLIMGFAMPLKAYFLVQCEKYDLRVMKEPDFEA